MLKIVYHMIDIDKNMSDKQEELIKKYFKNQHLAPGKRMNSESSYDQYQRVEQALSRKAKRTIDKSRTSHKYYLTKEIHTPTLNHYEDMEWWERDTTYDFYAYIDGKN